MTGRTRSTEVTESLGIAHEIDVPLRQIGDSTAFLQIACARLAEHEARSRQLLELARNGLLTPDQIASHAADAAEADVDYLLHQVPTAIKQCIDAVGRVSELVGALQNLPDMSGTQHKRLVALPRVIDNALIVARNELNYVADVKKEFDPDVPRVPCLAGELSQAVLNLLRNAGHAIAQTRSAQGAGRGVITIATAVDGEWAEIRIGDTGAGIPEDLREEIFDPCVGEDGNGSGGNGGGLAAARSTVVDMHGGSLSFESVVGEGTTFIVRLPMTPTSSRRGHGAS